MILTKFILIYKWTERRNKNNSDDSFRGLKVVLKELDTTSICTQRDTPSKLRLYNYFQWAQQISFLIMITLILTFSWRNQSHERESTIHTKLGALMKKNSEQKFLKARQE